MGSMNRIGKKYFFHPVFYVLILLEEIFDSIMLTVFLNHINIEVIR